MYHKTNELAGGDVGYYTTQTVFDINVRHFLDKEKAFKQLDGPFSSNLHAMLAGSLYNGSTSIKELLLKGEYKKAYDELNR